MAGLPCLTKKEDAMAGSIAQSAAFRAFEPVMGTIAGWARLWRIALGARNELAEASPRGGARMADAPGAVARAGEPPGGAPRLRQMLIALGVDPDTPGLPDHAAMDELRRQC